jgi:hypothetical protein
VSWRAFGHWSRRAPRTLAKLARRDSTFCPPRSSSHSIALPARRGAFVDARRIVAGEGGARAHHPKSAGRSSTSVCVPDCVIRRGRSGLGRRRALRFARLALERLRALRTSVLIATSVTLN